MYISVYVFIKSYIQALCVYIHLPDPLHIILPTTRKIYLETIFLKYVLLLCNQVDILVK